MNGELIINLLILLATMLILYIGWRAYRQHQEEKEKKAEVNQRLQELTQATATANDIIRISEELLVGLNYSLKPWVDPEVLGHVHGRILAIKEVAGTGNTVTESIIEDLAKRLKPFEADYRRRYVVGLCKVKPKYAEILLACL